MLTKIFGENMRRCRQAKGWSQERLAQKANVSTGTVSKLERGLTNATSDVYESVAKALGTSVAQLAGASEPE